MLEGSERRRERVHGARIVRMRMRGVRMNDKRRFKERASHPFELLPSERAQGSLASLLISACFARRFVVAIIRDDGL